MKIYVVKSGELKGREKSIPFWPLDSRQGLGPPRGSLTMQVLWCLATLMQDSVLPHNWHTVTLPLILLRLSLHPHPDLHYRPLNLPPLQHPHSTLTTLPPFPAHTPSPTYSLMIQTRHLRLAYQTTPPPLERHPLQGGSVL